MSPNIDGLAPRYLRTPEAARYVGLSIRCLEKHRIYGTGPRYSKIGRRVLYRVEDLQTWVDAAAKASTADPGMMVVLPAKPHTPAELQRARQGLRRAVACSGHYRATSPAQSGGVHPRRAHKALPPERARSTPRHPRSRGRLKFKVSRSSV